MLKKDVKEVKGNYAKESFQLSEPRQKEATNKAKKIDPSPKPDTKLKKKCIRPPPLTASVEAEQRELFN